jgi:hypothetical protein
MVLNQNIMNDIVNAASDSNGVMSSFRGIPIEE